MSTAQIVPNPETHRANISGVKKLKDRLEVARDAAEFWREEAVKAGVNPEMRPKRIGGWQRKIKRLEEALTDLEQVKNCVPQWRLDEVTRARRRAERERDDLKEQLLLKDAVIESLKRQFTERWRKKNG